MTLGSKMKIGGSRMIEMAVGVVDSTRIMMISSQTLLLLTV